MKILVLLLVVANLFAAPLFARTVSDVDLNDDVQYTIASDDSESEDEPQPDDEQPSDSDEENPES